MIWKNYNIENQSGKRSEAMWNVWFIVLALVAWFVLVRWVLPRMGVPT